MSDSVKAKNLVPKKRHRVRLVLLAIVVLAASFVSLAIYKMRESDYAAFAGKRDIVFKARDVLYSLSVFVNNRRQFIYSSGSFSGGEPGHWTWRFMVTRMEGDWPRELNIKVDEPWDGPRNIVVAMHPLAGRIVSRADKSALFVAVTGAGTIWNRSDEIVSLFNLEPSYLLFIEVKAADLNWLAPGDIDVSDLQSDDPLSAKTWCPTSIVATFSDGLIVVLRSDTPQNVLASLAQGECKSSDERTHRIAPWVIGEYRVSRFAYDF